MTIRRDVRSFRSDEDFGLPKITIEWPPAPRPKKPRLEVTAPRYGIWSVIAALGRICISIGILIFGFVGYQLWGTGIQTAAHQRELTKQFTKSLATSTTTSLPSTSSTATPVPATPSPLPAHAEGDPIALLSIDRIGVANHVILSGVSVADLKKGVGHFRTTPLPGQIGNAALAGHRTTSAAPFGRLDELTPGDNIVVTYGPEIRFVYQVADSKIVDPSEVDVLSPSTTPTLTLVTCHPKYTSTNRLIVRAVLNESLSSPPRTPTPLSKTETEPITSNSAQSASTTISVPETTVGEGAPESVLTEGWFSDSRAFPHVATWGAVCALIGIISWLISKKFRRNLIGFSIGIVPFVTAIYFFYENVNRLLPPGL
jgi:sortase A